MENHKEMRDHAKSMAAVWLITQKVLKDTSGSRLQQMKKRKYFFIVDFIPPCNYNK